MTTDVKETGPGARERTKSKRKQDKQTGLKKQTKKNNKKTTTQIRA